MFSGLFWSGQQAVELGLADQLGNLDYVAREVVKTDEIIDYTPRQRGRAPGQEVRRRHAARAR